MKQKNEDCRRNNKETHQKKRKIYTLRARESAPHSLQKAYAGMFEPFNIFPIEYMIHERRERESKKKHFANCNA